MKPSIHTQFCMDHTFAPLTGTKILTEPSPVLSMLRIFTSSYDKFKISAISLISFIYSSMYCEISKHYERRKGDTVEIQNVLLLFQWHKEIDGKKGECTETRSESAEILFQKDLSDYYLLKNTVFSRWNTYEKCFFSTCNSHIIIKCFPQLWKTVENS